MNKILFLSSLVLLTACAHYPDVRPGADGVHKVVVAHAEKSQAVQSALRQAKSYCEDKKQSAAFLKEKVEYTGSMDESTYHALGKISKAASAVGVVMGASSTTANQAKKSGVVTTSGVMANEAIADENAYTCTMAFKCI